MKPTKETLDFGVMNKHAIGIIMKELVRRAIEDIRNQMHSFEVTQKQGYRGQMDDMFTTADTHAQQVYIRSIMECFPQWGIIAEEQGHRRLCADGSGFFFSVDPLDGTRAFVRQQSHGIGTMLSLSRNDEFIAAFIGDVNTREIYGFRPLSSSVHRISQFNVGRRLQHKPRPLRDQYVLLRNPADEHTAYVKWLINNFKSNLVDGGSIGIWMARLWKGEVGAVILQPAMETPWDSNPVNAITERLGFVFLRPGPQTSEWVQFTPKPITEVYERDHEVLIVHRENMAEVLESFV